MKHVPAHLWSQLDGLAPSRRRAAVAHADECERCAETRDRIVSLDEVFASIREAEPADVEWDHVGARIHWSRSLERRTGERAAITELDLEPRRRWGLFAGGGTAAAAAAAAAVLLLGGGDDESLAVAPRAEPLQVVPVELAEGTALEALVIQVQGDVTVDGAEPDWNRVLVAGSSLATGDGEVTIQFGRGGGLSLGPRSTLELRSFDSHSIELVLEGTLEVQVAKRADNQQFIVVAADRTIRVRGTAFRVNHRAGDLDVACEHGRVEVSDGASVVGIDGSERLVAEDRSRLEDATAVELTAGERAELAAGLAMPLISAWRDARATLEATSTLSILAGDDAPVAIDGEQVGVGPMQLRLVAGRHQVAVEGAGAWSKGRWVDLDGGPDDVRIVHANHGRVGSGSKTPASAERIRRVQLRLALRENAVRMRRCASRLASHGVAKGAYVDLEVRVNADGTIGAVNAGTSSVDLRVRRCVLDAVSALTLPKGPKGRASVRWEF